MMVQAFMNIIVSMDNSCIKYDQRLFLGREKMRWSFILPTELKPTSGYQKKKKKGEFYITHQAGHNRKSGRVHTSKMNVPSAQVKLLYAFLHKARLLEFLMLWPIPVPHGHKK